MNSVLIIDDDDFIRLLLVQLLKDAGYTVYDASSGEAGIKMVETYNPDLVLTDYKMPGMSGIEVLAELVKKYPGLPVIILTAYEEVSLTIKAIQMGAFDFIEKPIKNWELLEAIQNGVQASNKSKSLGNVISPEARKSIEESLLTGKTPQMREIFKNIGRISLHKVNVLITGEPGTGKEQVARLIHYSGITRDHPFIVVNCNSKDERSLEHELFGYENNAIQGISGEKKGKFELAGEGVIFLDDFTELPISLQNKLLRVLQNNEIEKPGAEFPIPLYARVIASTNKDIEELIEQRLFSKELYIRLKVFSIHLPPLRERLNDIPELVQSLMQKLNRKLNKRVLKVEEGVNELLKKYDWPGNIRELENTLMQAIILSHGDVLEKRGIINPELEKSKKRLMEKNLVPISEVEKWHIKEVLEAVDWNKLEASTILEITRPTLNAKIEKYGLKPD